MAWFGWKLLQRPKMLKYAFLFNQFIFEVRGKEELPLVPLLKIISSGPKYSFLFNELNHECAALWEHADMSKAEIAYKLGRSKAWVSKWCEKTEFFDSSRNGRPRSALTEQNLRKLEACEVLTDHFTFWKNYLRGNSARVIGSWQETWESQKAQFRGGFRSLVFMPTVYQPSRNS